MCGGHTFVGRLLTYVGAYVWSRVYNRERGCCTRVYCCGTTLRQVTHPLNDIHAYKDKVMNRRQPHGHNLTFAIAYRILRTYTRSLFIFLYPPLLKSYLHTCIHCTILHYIEIIYFEMGHAELVPVADLQKPRKGVFYLSMQAVRKEHSTTKKIRAVFNACAKSSTGTSLSDTLLVGSTVHPMFF